MRDLTPRDWPTIERLFGPRGACGGCWCMVWRVSGGKAWLENKGEKNRRAFKRLVGVAPSAWRGERHPSRA